MPELPHKSRNITYDILKLILAWLVIYSHSYELLLQVENRFALFGRTPGNVAVHAFFVLSGFFITMSCTRASSTGDYVFKRIIRILPAYLVAIFFSRQIGALCNNFSELPTPYIINGCVWTLYYEIVLYAVIAVMKSAKVLTKEVLGSVVCVLWLLSMFNMNSSDALYTVILPMLFMFACGSYLYLASFEIKKGTFVASVFALILIQFFPSVFESIQKEITLIYGPELKSALSHSLYLFGLPVVIIGAGQIFHIDIPQKKYQFPDLSYGVYLFGWPIQQGLIYYFQTNGYVLTPETLLLLSTAASFVVASISWYALEMHVLKAKNLYTRGVQWIKENVAKVKSKHND